MTSVAISGAGGFVGKRLFDVLNADVVHGFDLPDIALNTDGIRVWDCRDETVATPTLRDYDVLIHLAALSGVGACKKNPDLAFRNNIEALSTVISACAETDTHLIFPSSHATYGDSLYGFTKNMGGWMTRYYPDLTSTVLEFSNIYGHYKYGGEEVVKNTVANVFLESNPIEVHGSGEQWRNFLHVDDAVQAYRKALDAEPGHYNVTGPNTHKIRELAEMVARRTGAAIEQVETDREEYPELSEAARTKEWDLPGYEPEVTLEYYLSERTGVWTTDGPNPE